MYLCFELPESSCHFWPRLTIVSRVRKLEDRNPWLMGKVRDISGEKDKDEEDQEEPLHE